MAAQVNDRKKTLNSIQKCGKIEGKIRCVSKEVTSLKPKTGVNFVQKMQCFQCDYSLES